MKFTEAIEIIPCSEVLPLTREWIEMQDGGRWEANGSVLPLTREWIEITIFITPFLKLIVLPLTREWIEIDGNGYHGNDSKGSPSYEGVD